MNRLKLLRKRKGLTIKELEHEVNISNATISRLETGLTSFTDSYLIVLSKYFKVSIDYLLGIDKKIDLKITNKLRRHCKIVREYIRNKDLFTLFLKLNDDDKNVLKDIVEMAFTLNDEYLYQIKGYILACKENQINQERERSYLKREGKNE